MKGFKLNEDGTPQRCSNLDINNPLYEGFKPLDLLEVDENGELYKYYLLDIDTVTGKYERDMAKITDAVNAKAESDASISRDEEMLLGVKYTLNSVDYMVSVTKDDGDGIVQVKTAFDLGATSTNIHFKNGTKMPMVVADFNAFALWFIVERNKFFV